MVKATAQLVDGFADYQCKIVGQMGPDVDAKDTLPGLWVVVALRRLSHTYAAQ